MNPNDTVLLVDDNELDLLITERMIITKFESVKVVKAETVDQAFDVMSGDGTSDGIKQNLPHYILLDINMPVMNGWDFLVKYDMMGLADSNCKIYMLTSSDHEEDKIKSKSFGFVKGFIVKPLEPKIIETL